MVRQTLSAFADELVKIAADADPAIYAPEVYGHEAGHYGYQQRLGKWKKPIDVASTAGQVGGGLATLGGLIGLGTAGTAQGQRRAALVSALGQGVGVLSDIPRLVEETAASKRSLKSLEGKLTPEEMDVAKKRLFRAGATYYAPVIGEAVAAGLTGAGALAKNPYLSAAGMIGGLTLAPAGGLIGQDIAARKMSEVEGGKMMTGKEIQQLHGELAPDINLSLSDKPSRAGAFYMGKIPKKSKWKREMARGEMQSLGLKGKDATKFMDEGGIFMGKTWTPEEFHKMTVLDPLKDQPISKSRRRKIERKLKKKFQEKETKRKQKLELKARAKELRDMQRGDAA